MKWALVGLAALLLAACQPTAQQEARIKATLPAGCEVRYLGSYGDVEHVVVVLCDGRHTATTNYAEPVGKSEQRNTTVTIE